MNSDERILQVLESSACLSKGQLLGYIKHTLYPEELRAVELHLSGCPICNDALDGLELQANVEELLSSMIPPVLPAIVPKEKPKEKKEVAPVIKVEKTPPASKVAEVSIQENHDGPEVRKTFNWKRPLGIAAALAIGFSALWYFELRPQASKEIADNRESQAEMPAAGSVNENRPIAAAPATEQAKETALLADAVKTKDSLLIAKKEDKARIRKDSINAAPVMAARQSMPMQTATEHQEDTQANNKAEQAAAKVAAARSKEKEESPKKEELSDYENGLKLYKQNQYASALLYLKQVESDENNPKHWDAVFYSALCNKYLGKDRRARKQFERIIKADGSYKKAAQKQLDEMKNKD